MNRIQYKLLCSVVALNVVGAAARLHAATEIKLRARGVPHGSVVRLADVAEVSAESRQESRRLGALPLMPAPAPGTERYLWSREIQDMIAAQGVEIGDFHFTGDDRVAVAAADLSERADGGQPTNAATPAPKNRHAAILAGFCTAQPDAANKLGEARTAELRRQLNEIIGNYLNTKTGKLAPWKIDCAVSERDLVRLGAATSAPICTGGSEPWSGQQRFLVTFSTANGQVQLSVAATVSPPPVPVVVAVRPISRGDVITAADLELRALDLSSKSLSDRAIESVDKIIGMEARQAIQVGDVVLADEVRPPILVKRGDIVTVTSQSGGIRVRTTAKALHDGSRGDLVQVESLASHQKYDVQVVAMREAAVFTISRPEMPKPTTRFVRRDHGRQE